MKQGYKEAIKYAAVGIIGLGVDWGTFFIFRDLLGIDYILAHICSSSLAIINNFVLNSYFTFKATDKIWRRAVSFFSIAGIGLVVGAAMLPLLVDLLNACAGYFGHNDISQKIMQNVAKLGVTVFVAILQFFLNKYFTFKKKAS